MSPHVYHTKQMISRNLLRKRRLENQLQKKKNGDKGRKISETLVVVCPFSVSERTTVDTVFERYLQDKALETTKHLHHPQQV